MVRVRCYQAQNEASEEARSAALEAAEDLVETSGNLAAALFLARQVVCGCVGVWGGE
jgi:hypothetical protein